jgi:hypothetical protein
MTAGLLLQRIPGERRAFALGDVGVLRYGGGWRSDAVAEADGSRWELRREGWLGRQATAIPELGGEPVLRWHARGGELTWHGRALRWSRRGLLRRWYELDGADGTLARFTVGSIRGSVRVELLRDDVPALLLLFGSWLARTQARDEDTATASAATVGATAATG